jgi:hypothetical protein
VKSKLKEVGRGLLKAKEIKKAIKAKDAIT